MTPVNNKKLLKILLEISETTNPFSVNDILLYFNLPRNSEGREILDLEYGLTPHVIAQFIRRSDKFMKAETRTCGGRTLWKRVDENDLVR